MSYDPLDYHRAQHMTITAASAVGYAMRMFGPDLQGLTSVPAIIAVKDAEIARLKAEIAKLTEKSGG